MLLEPDKQNAKCKCIFVHELPLVFLEDPVFLPHLTMLMNRFPRLRRKPDLRLANVGDFVSALANSARDDRKDAVTLSIFDLGRCAIQNKKFDIWDRKCTDSKCDSLGVRRRLASYG